MEKEEFIFRDSDKANSFVKQTANEIKYDPEEELHFEKRYDGLYSFSDEW